VMNAGRFQSLGGELPALIDLHSLPV